MKRLLLFSTATFWIMYALVWGIIAIYPERASAEDLDLVVVSETATTITFSYALSPGAEGYRYYTGTYSGDVVTYKAVARTFNPAQLQVKFAKGAEAYRVTPLDISERADGYSFLSRAACNDKIDNDADGKIDYPADPGCVRKNDTDEFDAPAPPPGNSANVWVSATGGSCVRSATLVVWSATTACNSFAAAYSAAQSGDVVGVTGSLGTQKFAGGYQSTQPSGTKVLTFKGIPGNKVRQIHFGSVNLTFDGIDADAGGAQTTGAVFENGGRPFIFKNGRIGNVADEKAALVTGAGIVFDNVIFHDAVIKTNGVHMECIWAGVPEGMIVRNSRFENCAVMDIFFTYPDYWVPLPPPYGNVTLENNYFDYPRSFNGSTNGFSIYVAKNGVSLSNQTPMSGWRVRNNFFREDPNSNQDYGVNVDQPLGSNNIFCGNTGHPNMPSNWKVAC